MHPLPETRPPRHRLPFRMRRRGFLRHLRRPALPWLATLSAISLSLASLSSAQLQIENRYQNIFSLQGPPAAPDSDPLIPGQTEPLRPAYDAQWRNGSALGGTLTTRIRSGPSPDAPVVAGSPDTEPGETTLILPSFGEPGVAGGVQLARATIGRPLVVSNISYALGSVIPRPAADIHGQPVEPDFYRAEPVNTTLPDGSRNEAFYWSPHARKVYATQPGVIEIIWQERVSGIQRSETYTISTAPAKPERKIFWTENGFNGPKVEVPDSRVSEVVFVYNALVPPSVPVAFESPYATPPDDPSLLPPPEKRTIWYDRTDRHIHAYNREGRVFLEYLGNVREDGATREQLGYEIVNIIREMRPVTLKVDIGEPVGPPPDIPAANGTLLPDPNLQYTIIAGYGLTTQPYLYEHVSQGGTRYTLYAIRQTEAGAIIDGVEQQTSNEVLIYWKEAGERGIYWPKYYAGYIFEWPASQDRYSTYARSSQAAGDAADTSVRLDAANNPALVYQDDPSNRHAVLAPGNLFYTNVTSANPVGRSLIRYTSGDEIWFERVYSQLDTTFAGYSSPAAVDIGTRITPPAGTDTHVGYIRQPAGNAFAVDAYVDPFVSGFAEAEKGSIIGVNALSGKDRLEVWWFRKSRPPGSLIQPTYWPSVVRTYRLRWPASPPEIVLASNAGSDALPSRQASGTIYYQNDPSLPGYNPNEEHALMLNGRAWALRDDLNLPTSSAPYVLLSWRDADSRPSMTVFKVLRENDQWKFRYPATAGTVLQAPMPLPILPPPLRDDGRLASYEYRAPDDPPDIPDGFDMARDAEFMRYRRFTWIDRKGTVWILRGPNAGNPEDSDDDHILRMRYFYRTLDGFHFPDRAAQPPPGTITPYLRPLASSSNPVAGYIGDPVTGAVSGEPLPRPQDIVFTPRWPESVPELRIGETLTVAKLGMPAVRGQTSVEILYEQSIATDPESDKPLAERKRSARLFDPTRARSFALDEPGKGRLDAIPDSIRTSRYLGKIYFPNLPPHLSRRFFLDPAVGKHGSLQFVGEFVDEPAGEKYLLLNVLSAADRAALIGLCDNQDIRFALWSEAIDGLETTVETFCENPERRGTYVVDRNKEEITEPDEFGIRHTVATPSATDPPRQPTTYGAGDLAEIFFSDSAVDSCALSASGGGQGYVVFAAGNGVAFTPPGEPVSLHIVRVTPPLYRGELKVIASANPLDEKLTLQHSGDFAGHPEDFDFEWRYAPPVDGVPPLLYTYERTLILGDSSGTEETEWRLFEDPAGGTAHLRVPGAPLSGSKVVHLPSQVTIRREGSPAAGPDSPPAAVLRRRFTADSRPLRLFLSLEMSALTGAVVYLNHTEVAVTNIPGRENTLATAPPGGGFDPLPLTFEIHPSSLRIGENVLTIELSSAADPGSSTVINARLEGTVETEHSDQWLAISPGPFDVPPGETAGSVNGKVRHVIEGSSLLTLTDNYFIMRYRARTANNAAYEPPGSGGGWSKWTDPQLGEGWIKRVLAGINPFQQRVTDLFNNPVNTDVSLLTQAGKRWEGDIPLTLENINDFGLIEIYETVLRRGRMLSIDGTPRINYDGANDALLLAAGYLNDLYMLLGNEAFADAANPTIAYSEVLGGNAGNIATSLFAFRGQEASVLDEELGLLRGRDDMLQPGTRVAPAYNRLFWNYTRGIDSGEAIYALNYNIRDVNLDGVVDAEDAAILYPQGHGDAYGHYLTALTNYYGLLNNEYFSWTPRTEAVLVLGQPVQVDYMDERKFAAAAAALARTGWQIVDLTVRKQYSAAESGAWSGYSEETVNPRTGMARHWGADQWATRTGQGALFHWVTANSLLPETDPDPDHEGIRKIDRTTVPELREIAAQAAAVQQTLDQMDARLNPLGLAQGAVPFDINPTFLDTGSTATTGSVALQGLTHFDQIFQRAISAVKNAASAFANAESSTRFLRSQEDSLAAQLAAINEQETAYTNQLIEIYGTPYTDDIGPGRTYPQGYTGPDLIHPMYVEITENLAKGEFTPIEESRYTLYTLLDPETLRQISFSDFGDSDPIPGVGGPVEFVLDAISGDFRKPEKWEGRRVSPGRIQTAISNQLLARQELFGALYDFDRLSTVIRHQIALCKSAIDAHDEAQKHRTINAGTQTGMRAIELALDTAVRVYDQLKDTTQNISNAVSEGAPKSVGTSNDPSFTLRLTVKSASSTTSTVLDTLKTIAETAKQASELARESMDQFLEIDVEEAAWKHENTQLLHDLRQSLQDYIDSSGTIDATYRNYDQAKREVFALLAEGDRLQQQRLAFRQRAAALVQGYRTRDFAFRAFRNEALEKYKTLFDLAARYTHLAASAYDYETGLLDPDGSSAARTFYEKIVRARSLGVVIEGVPQAGGSTTGDPGLAGVLAQMAGDWSVVKPRFGLNNPSPSQTTFSLRTEAFRILNGAPGDKGWHDVLVASLMDDITEDVDVRRHCMQIADPTGQAVPGLVIPFSTTITEGSNFFGRPLAGGDHTFTPTAFATKIRSSGIALAGYIGMDPPPGVTAGVVGEAGGESPPDPNTGFTDPSALSATPYVYLIPAGTDFMRSPPLGDSSVVRRWQVQDQAIPLPFNIGESDYASNSGFLSIHSLSEPMFTIRKHPAFRAVPDGTNFPASRTFTNSRLIGRSVWNSRWKIVIPGRTLLANPQEGLQVFLSTVRDIRLHFETYSYSGN